MFGLTTTRLSDCPAFCAALPRPQVIHALQQHKEHHVLMCGDGGNDVGALKQASAQARGRRSTPAEEGQHYPRLGLGDGDADVSFPVPAPSVPRCCRLGLAPWGSRCCAATATPTPPPLPWPPRKAPPATRYCQPCLQWSLRFATAANLSNKCDTLSIIPIFLRRGCLIIGVFVNSTPPPE